VADAPGSRKAIANTRIVLLGASNLERGLAHVATIAEQLLETTPEVFAALGAGRSFGRQSLVLARGLPSVLHCGLWEKLAESSPQKTFALLTDVGNDILYDAPVTQIVQWVEACLQRLEKHQARIVMTSMPLESINRLGRKRFLFMRSVLTPTCRLDLPTVLERAARVNEQLHILADRYNAALVAPRGEWYGFDPIHIRRSQLTSAWGEILSSWRTEQPLPASFSPPSFKRCLRIRRLKPESRTMFGWPLRREQPAGRLSESAPVWLY